MKFILRIYIQHILACAFYHIGDEHKFISNKTVEVYCEAARKEIEKHGCGTETALTPNFIHKAMVEYGHIFKEVDGGYALCDNITKETLEIIFRRHMLGSLLDGFDSKEAISILKQSIENNEVSK